MTNYLAENNEDFSRFCIQQQKFFLQSDSLTVLNFLENRNKELRANLKHVSNHASENNVAYLKDLY